MKPSIGSICARDVAYEIPNRPHVLPLIASSGFDFDTMEEGIEVFTGKKSGMVYGRYGNPTIEAVARKIADLEGYDLAQPTEALLVSSGMAAISTLVISLFKPGDVIVTQGNIYGGTTELFQKVIADLGIDIVFLDLSQMSNLTQLLDRNNRVKGIFFESPSNPNQECVDMTALNEICKAHKIITIADNTLPTPLFQRPLNFGIDYVVHSTTKFLNGHGNSIGGVIVSCHQEEMKRIVWERMKLLGTNLSPFEAWLLHNGLKTLHVRMKVHQQNAFKLASFLEQHPRVPFVRHLGLDSHPHHRLASKQMNGYGCMIAAEIEGGQEAALSFMNKLNLCSRSPTLGDVDTLVMHPATSSHLKVPAEIRSTNGITQGLVRFSVGIEEVSDLIGDVEQALS